MKSKNILTVILLLSVLLQCRLNQGPLTQLSLSLGDGSRSPAGIGVMTVRISAEDMETIEESFPLDKENLLLTIPSGPKRLVELFTSPAAGSKSAVLKWEGAATVDLPDGESISLAIEMAPTESRLLIPDQLGSRIVQFDRFDSGSEITTWQELSNTTVLSSGLTLGETLSLDGFAPADIDLDSLGRIYIAHNTWPASVIRFNDISGEGSVKIADLSMQNINGVNAITIDRKNHIIYFSADGNRLFSMAMTPASVAVEVTLTEIESFTISGLSVDGDGFLYLSDSNYMGDLYKIDPKKPEGSRVLLASGSNPFITPEEITDVIVKGEAVYYLNNGLEGYSSIVKLDRSLNYLTHMEEDPNNPQILEPRHFFSGINSNLYLIDEPAMDYGDLQRFIEMDDVGGNVWNILSAPDGYQTGEFILFYYFPVS